MFFAKTQVYVFIYRIYLFNSIYTVALSFPLYHACLDISQARTSRQLLVEAWAPGCEKVHGTKKTSKNPSLPNACSEGLSGRLFGPRYLRTQGVWKPRDVHYWFLAVRTFWTFVLDSNLRLLRPTKLPRITPPQN